MAGVGKSETLTWSVTLLITCLFGVGIGLSLGYAIFKSPEGVLEVASESNTEPSADLPDKSLEIQDPPPGVSPSTGSETEAPPSTPASEKLPARAQNPDRDDIWAARHLFIAVNGQWLAEGTKALIRDLRPGGVVLRAANLRDSAQTLELVKEIKLAGGMGGGLGGLPLIAVQEEIGPLNRLGLRDSPSAGELGRRGDEGLARAIGEEYARACVERGIGVTFSPVLDVYESGSVDPGFEMRSFGNDQTVVARMGLAMVDGMRRGGIISAVKHFPGYGASTYGADGTLVVLNKDINGIAKVIYPFTEAIRQNVQGIIVGYMAVPALDKAEPRRPAALSPVLVTDLLRNRWGFDGVILAGDASSNNVTLSQPVEQSAVAALAAGCDAVVLLDVSPQRIRLVRDAIEEAVRAGVLNRESLQKSKERLDQWQEVLNKTSSSGNVDAQRMTKSITPPVLVPSKPQVPKALPNSNARTAKATTRVEAKNPSTASAAPGPIKDLRATTEPKTEPITLAAPEEDTAGAIEKPADTPSPSEVESSKVPPENPASVTVVLERSRPKQNVELKDPTATKPSGSVPEEDSAPTQVVAKVVETEPPTGPVVLPIGESKADTTLSSRTEALSAAMNAGEIEHTVRENEFLSSIASIYGVSAADIVRWNELSDAKLEPGSKLIIRFEPAQAPEAEPVPEDDAKLEGDSPEVELELPTYKIIHIAKRNQDMNDLAKKYAVSTENLKVWNDFDEESLEAGQEVTVFLGDPNKASDTMPELKLVDYKVKVGDTLSSIGRTSGSTPELLMQLNGLKDPNHIWVGQKLKLPEAK